MIVKGKDLRIFIADWNPLSQNLMVPKSIFHATECAADFQTSYAKIVRKTTGAGEDFIPERLTWSMAGAGLIVDDSTPNANIQELFSFWRLRKSFHVSMRLDEDYENAFYISGQAYIQNLAIQANSTGPAQLSYELQCVNVPALRIFKKVTDPFQIFDYTFTSKFE